MLTPPEGITTMTVDASGNFICNGSSAGRVLPVWTDNPQALCQASQPQPSAQQGQQDGEGVADWIKQMFGQ